MAQRLSSGSGSNRLKYLVVGAISEHLESPLGELCRLPGFQCLQLVRTLREATALLEESECHVILLLQAGPPLLSAVTDCRAAHPDTGLLAVAETITPPALEALLRAGLGGFLFDQDVVTDGAEALRSVARGEVFVSNRIISDVLRHMLAGVPGPARSGVDSLTERELIIFKLIGSGLKGSEIAQRLNLSHRTIEAHREKIKHRLGFADSGAVTRFACVWVQANLLSSQGLPTLGASGMTGAAESGIPDASLGDTLLT